MSSIYARIVAAVTVFVAINAFGFFPVRAQNMGSIDPITAYQILPSADMAQDVWSDTPTSYVPAGWTRVRDWNYFFPQEQTTKMAASGFYAAVYYQAPNSPNGTANVIIAYRSTTLGDVGTDAAALQGQIPDQYKYAVQLAQAVENKYPGATISLTGHSLGGALATYAGQNVPGIANVTTFNSPRPPILSAATLGGVNQINVVVANDFVGGPKQSVCPFNCGYLPGKTYEVASTTVTPQDEGTHSLLGIIGGLKTAENSSAGLQLKPPQSGPTTTVAASQTAPTVQPPAVKQNYADISHSGPPAATKPTMQGNVPVITAPTTSVPTPKNAERNAVSLQPPPTPRPTTQYKNIAPVFVPRSGSTFAQPTVMAAAYRPGGISLSRAAAERMSMNIDLEGLHYSNGQVLLTGHHDSSSSIDAALFLTALRSACEATEPYFSLDADNGPAWVEEGQRAMAAVWEVAKRDYEWVPHVPGNRGPNARIPDGLTIRALSVRRDFPDLWAKMAPSYPDLRTRLVFRPAWLRETRFGEILYKADVLLKELASGVSIVNPNGSLRAAGIDGYAPALMRRTAGGLFDPNRDVSFKQSRLWFDLVPQDSVHADAAPAALPILDRSRNPELYQILARHGYIESRTSPTIQKAALYASGDDTDLSGLYPKMFVRRHDFATKQDILGTDPYLSALSSEINEHSERYVAAYKELRDLTEVFRAYVASVAIVRQDDSMCPSLHGAPLYDAEKISTPLPEMRPSELIIDVLMYVTRTGKGRLLSLNAGKEIDGGIALRAKELYEQSTIAMETKVMADLKGELAAPAPAAEKAVWTGSSGRDFILLNLREPESARIEPQPYVQEGAAPASPVAIKRTSDRYLMGEGYKSFIGSSYGQCEQLCVKESACAALNFDRSSGGCQLFNQVGATSANNLMDFGVKDLQTAH